MFVCKICGNEKDGHHVRVYCDDCMAKPIVRVCPCGKTFTTGFFNNKPSKRIYCRPKCSLKYTEKLPSRSLRERINRLFGGYVTDNEFNQYIKNTNKYDARI